MLSYDRFYNLVVYYLIRFTYRDSIMVYSSSNNKRGVQYMVETDIMYGGAFQAMPSNIDKIKLNKNTNAKGDIHYEWEIQTMGLDIEKIRKLNNELLAIYG